MGEGSNGATKAPELVTITIDGKELRVPKGMNLIEAAKIAGVEVPHYCYHPHLSIAGNCRMCQVRIEGMPKMEIACNTMVRDGMKVQTHQSSKEVQDSQAATLEFILINHPLDCTVCDQAGHCKLQDYHYEYNARPSRFVEQKEKKVKAQPLGPTVMLDGERCIMCTRCIRFCDEVTGTSELGMLNRGDRSVIAVSPGKELTNPLSGTVVDLCPVGALTHREWRFNTRIWFTEATESICPGCSTGCNVKVHTRDGEIVQVKGRMNTEVNKEWLCDEGRYGFNRFLPASRLTTGLREGRETSIVDAATAARGLLQQGESLVLLSADLLLEEYAFVKKLLARLMPQAKVAIAYRERVLTEVEKILISPDYAANFRGAEYAGLVAGNLEASYREALSALRSGKFSGLLVIGDRAILPEDSDPALLDGVSRCALSVGLVADGAAELTRRLKVALPARSILEKSGLVINRAHRLQYTDRVLSGPEGAEPAWRLLHRIAEGAGAKLTTAQNDREFTMRFLAEETRLAGLSISAIKRGGIDLAQYKAVVGGGSGVVEAQSAL